MAYPYVARRWLAGDTSEMREKPLEMENHSTSPNLLQVAGARLKLLRALVGRDRQSLP